MAFGDWTRSRRNGDSENLPQRRNGGHDDPFQRLQREMNDLFNTFFSSGSMGSTSGLTRAGGSLQGRESGGMMRGFHPSVDVSDQGENIVVQAELPGMSADDVEVTLEEDHLTIKGEKSQESKVEEEGFFRSERSFGSFRRTIGFPSAVNTDKANAKFNNGVLTVTLPKSEGARKAKKLDIKEG